MLDLNVGASG